VDAARSDLAAMLALEGWQLFALYQMRDEISQLDQKLTGHLQTPEQASVR
jgi:hypothetical protein